MYIQLQIQNQYLHLRGGGVVVVVVRGVVVYLLLITLVSENLDWGTILKINTLKSYPMSVDFLQFMLGK